MGSGSPRTVILPLPGSVAFSERGCLVSLAAWFSRPLHGQPRTQHQCGVGGQSLPDLGARLCICASCCLSQTKHQEKPRGGFGIKCPPDGVNKRLWKCPGAWGFQKDSFQGRWPLRREASCYVPACQGRKGPQASSGSAAPLQAGWTFRGWQPSGAGERRGGGPSIGGQLGFQTLMTFPALFSATTA